MTAESAKHGLSQPSRVYGGTLTESAKIRFWDTFYTTRDLLTNANKSRLVLFSLAGGAAGVGLASIASAETTMCVTPLTFGEDQSAADAGIVRALVRFPNGDVRQISLDPNKDTSVDGNGPSHTTKKDGKGVVRDARSFSWFGVDSKGNQVTPERSGTVICGNKGVIEFTGKDLISTGEKATASGNNVDASAVATASVVISGTATGEGGNFGALRDERDQALRERDELKAEVNRLRGGGDDRWRWALGGALVGTLLGAAAGTGVERRGRTVIINERNQARQDLQQARQALQQEQQARQAAEQNAQNLQNQFNQEHAARTRAENQLTRIAGDRRELGRLRTQINRLRTTLAGTPSIDDIRNFVRDNL